MNGACSIRFSVVIQLEQIYIYLYLGVPFVFTRLLTTGLSVDRSVGGRVCYVERKMACYDAGAVCKGLSWSHHGGGVLAGLDRLI